MQVAGSSHIAAVAALAAVLLNPSDPEWRKRAPDTFVARLDTSRGVIRIAVERAWAPVGADRFYNLVRLGFYDDTRFFRVVSGRWAQFGIHGTPAVARTWRTQTLPDDSRTQSNVRGTVAFAWAVPQGRSTQVFIHLEQDATTLDAQGFAPFGRVVEGMDVADALNAEYGEAIGGIRAGKQDPVFQGGNDYLTHHFPRLDFIRRVIIEEP
jgi:cyclophilin family peptidyl-prolyl cis-trans isomerase